MFYKGSIMPAGALGDIPGECTRKMLENQPGPTKREEWTLFVLDRTEIRFWAQ